MRKNLFVRSIAAVSGIVMLASLAACGDNTRRGGDSFQRFGFTLQEIINLLAGGHGLKLVQHIPPPAEKIIVPHSCANNS